MATSEELQQQIELLMQQITVVQNERQAYLDENERIEKYLSDFTTRQGVLLTIAGLLTLLPLADNQDINYFLLWSIPFLILSIAFYILSSKRINFIGNDFAMPLNYSDVNLKLRDVYFKSFNYFRLTDSLLIIFFTSFIINFYLTSFNFDINLYFKFFVLIFSLIVGIIRYFSLKNSDEISYGQNILYAPTVPYPDNNGKY